MNCIGLLQLLQELTASVTFSNLITIKSTVFNIILFSLNTHIQHPKINEMLGAICDLEIADLQNTCKCITHFQYVEIYVHTTKYLRGSNTSFKGNEVSFYMRNSTPEHSSFNLDILVSLPFSHQHYLGVVRSFSNF
jgi:hypothetical protein